MAAGSIIGLMERFAAGMVPGSPGRRPGKEGGPPGRPYTEIIYIDSDIETETIKTRTI